MKKLICSLVLVGLVGTAYAKERDVGNGGDACMQTIPQVVQWLGESLTAQGEKAYPEFEYSVLKFFIKNTQITLVPQTLVDGQETDAKNYPEQKLIELSRPRWCGLSDAKKTSVLFHEYLGVMGLEGTNQYGISSRLTFINDADKRKQEEEARQKRWYCSASVYVFSRGEYNSSKSRYLHSASYLGIVGAYGPNAADAFGALADQAKDLAKYSSGTYTTCNNIGGADTEDLYCAQESTPTNACFIANP